MQNKRHSIKDIANANGVSITTVSFVLNGKAEEKKISKEVTKKILDFVKEIDYKPNQLARGLRTGKSKLIVFMVEDFYFFFAKLATIIEDLAFKKGYKVIFCTNENKDNKSIELIDLYRNIKVDGYIIVPSPGLMPKIKELMDEAVPVILTDRFFPDLDCNYVVIDNKEASYNATKHLIANNFKNIGFITNDIEQTQMLDRLAGYETAITESNLTKHVIKIPIEKYTLSRHKLESDIKKFIEKTPQLDAIYFATNYLAISGLNILKKNGLQGTEKLGIMSFDDLDFFEFYTPSITAVQQPYFEIAESIMDLMFKLLKGGKRNNETTKIKLKTDLKIRNSSSPKME